MTERWRKKLGDLDHTGPSDEVFDRAHEGPQHPDDVIPLPKTSTKIVTGVAAFLVFALAISVFAIPALRMATPGAPAGPSTELPLWPARSLDDLESFQQRADSGEADAVWALDPQAAAERFGSDVLGWDEVGVSEIHAVGDCSEYMVCGARALAGPSGYPTSYPTGSPTSPPPASRVIVVLTNASCVLPCREISVEMYQPLGSGDGSIWALRQVRSSTSEIGATGGRLRDGDSIYAGTQLFRGDVPTLAYHVGPGSCDVDYATSEWAEGVTGEQPGTLPVTGAGLTLPVQHGCTEPTPGYVWLATAADSLIANDESGHVADPFAEGGTMLTSLTAVPVTFVPPYPTGSFTEMPPTGGPPTAAPTPTLVEPTGWTTYRADEAFGWSIDVPSTVDVSPVDDGVKFVIDGEPLVTIIRLSGAPPADDSTFPVNEDPSGEFTFRGDGQAFGWIAGAHWEEVDPEPGTMARMLLSLDFKRWSWGERRNGFTALEFPTGADTTWPNIQGNVIALFAPDGDPRAVDFPDSCGEGQNMTIKQGHPVIECPDGTELRYDENGMPDADNPPGYQEQVPTYVVVRGHDGHVLVQLP